MPPSSLNGSALLPPQSNCFLPTCLSHMSWLMRTTDAKLDWLSCRHPGGDLTSSRAGGVLPFISDYEIAIIRKLVRSDLVKPAASKALADWGRADQTCPTCRFWTQNNCL